MLILSRVRPAMMLAAGLMLMLCGCGGGPKFPRAAVRGTVSVGGQPLAAGIVRFTPVDGKGPPAVAAVSNGSYALSALEGPVVGENQIEIDGSPVLPGMSLDDEVAYAKMITEGGGEGPKNPVPPQYRTNKSPLRKVVEAAKENVFEFPLEALTETASPESNF